MLIVLGHRAGVDIAASAIHGNAGRQQRQSHDKRRNWPTAPVDALGVAGLCQHQRRRRRPPDLARGRRALPDDYPQTYGIRSFFGL